MKLTKTCGNSNRKLAVAHFIPWSGIGGTEIATLRMVEATKDRFHHVAFCLEGAGVLKSWFEKAGIEVVTYHPPEPSLRHAGRFYKESKAVTRQLRQIDADIVHFADEKAAYHNSFAALLARCRIVSHIRVSFPHLSLRRRLCLLPVRSFVFVSKEAQRSFDMSLSARKTRVIYDAVDIPVLDPAEENRAVRREFGIPDKSTLVGMVARISPQKDYFTLATSAAEILARYPGTQFLIVGDNSIVDLNRNHYNEVAKKLHELGIADKFIFTGHRNDISRLIAAMDICVLCTHQEGFPLSILETMAMQKPIVATAVGGIPEIVESGVTGYLHQHGDSHGLTDAIASLIEDPEKSKQIGVAAREIVQRNYSRPVFAENISNVYMEIMDR